jgi:hypothetical protein
MGPETFGIPEDLPLSETVRAAFDAAATACPDDRPLQTGMLLATLAAADGGGDWARVWPSYNGSADRALAGDNDGHPDASAASWNSVALSDDLLGALQLLAEMAARYAMNPVQPGAAVLALTANSGTAAARHLCALSGYGHTDLLGHIQSDVLGTTLDGFGELAGAEATDRDQPESVSRRGWRSASVSWIAAIACVFAAWLALRAVADTVIGTTAVCVILALTFGERRQTSHQGERPSRIEWSAANYGRPPQLAALVVSGLFVVMVISWRRPLGNLFGPVIAIGIVALAFLLFACGLRAKYVLPRASGAASASRRPGADHSRHGRVGAAVTCGLSIALLAWISRAAIMKVTTSVYAHNGEIPVWPSPAARWLDDRLRGALLGGWLGHGYSWPLLAGTAGAVAGYFAALSVDLLSGMGVTEHGRLRRPRWAVMGLAGLSVIALSYSPVSRLLPPAPDLYVENAIETGIIYTNLPRIIGLDNVDYISDLRWKSNRSNASAVGVLHQDKCLPDCARGDYRTYPIDILASDPRECAVETYSGFGTWTAMNAYIFTDVRVSALKGSPPRYLLGTLELSPACT